MQAEGRYDSNLGLQSFMTGHLYECPNGHLFVIGECGQAMQVCITGREGGTQAAGMGERDPCIQVAARNTLDGPPADIWVVLLRRKLPVFTASLLLHVTLVLNCT